MSNEIPTGKELQKRDLNQREINSSGSFSLRAWVAAEWQLAREMLPGPLPSKEADKLMLDMLEAMAQEIGVDQFHAVILKVIETCERRPTVATFRKLAGLNQRLDPHADALAAAWSLVTDIVLKHIGRNGEGQAILQPRTYRDGEVWREESVPEIPEGIKRTISMMGGWGAVSDSYPQWFGQRFQQFKELWRGHTSTSISKT